MAGRGITGERLSAGTLPTVADLLALPELALGRPHVVAGEQELRRPVRWVDRKSVV